jgi:hypothetical protein
MATKLGFSDRKTEAPQNMPELISFLSTLLSATVNNEVELETAKTASNIADRIIQAVQADTRMKAVAIATQRSISSGNQGEGYALIDMAPKAVGSE